MKTNNKRSILMHLVILVIGLAIIFNPLAAFNFLMIGVGNIIFVTFINLLYFVFGYLYGVDTGKATTNLLSFGLIAWIGVGVWIVCMFIYLFSDEKQSFYGSEIVWFLSIGYNYPSMYLMKAFHLDLSQSLLTPMLLLFNFYQSILLWLGLQTRLFVRKML